MLLELCENATEPDAIPLDVDLASTRIVGTARWRSKDRLPLWTDFVRTHSMPIVMPNTPAHDYRTIGKLQDRGDVTINQAVSDPLGFERTSRHAATLRSDRVRISYCAQVDGGIESGRTAAPITDGAVYFRDYHGPGRFWTHAPLHETWLFVPRDWFVEGGRAIRDFDCAVFQSDGFLAGLLAQRIKAVAAHANDAAARFGEAVQNLRRTIEDAFAARTSESHRRSLRVKADRLRRIKAFLTQHAGDDDLNSDRIADELGIARSTLYRLVKEENLQIGSYVAEYRLNAIRSSLADAAWAGHSIGEIAALWGHLDQAYFARAFKRRFGVTPSQYRAAVPAAVSRPFR